MINFFYFNAYRVKFVTYINIYIYRNIKKKNMSAQISTARPTDAQSPLNRSRSPIITSSDINSKFNQLIN